MRNYGLGIAVDEGDAVDAGVVRHFQTFAEEYDESSEWCSDPRLLAPLVEGIHSQRALDLGCGTGLVAEAIRARGRKVLGLDLSYPMLRKAKTRVGSGLVEGAAEALPFRTGSLDLVVCRQLLHYTREAEVLCEAARVLRERGELRLAQVTSCDDRDFVFWSVFKTVIQPLRRRSYSPNLLRSVVERCCFEVQDLRSYSIRRRYSLEMIHRLAPLAAGEQKRFLAWMRDELVRLDDLLEPVWSGDGVTLNQFWTFLICVTR